MLHLTPLGIPILTWSGLGWLALLFFLCGLVGSFSVPFVANALDNTRRAKAERAASMPEGAQRKIDELYRLLAESKEREKEEARENAALRRLARERANFDRFNDSRSSAAMHGRAQ